MRRFKSLKTICLRGNPFCEKNDYSIYVLSHLSQIVYIDYRLVDQSIVRTTNDNYNSNRNYIATRVCMLCPFPKRNEGAKRFEIDLQQIASNEETEDKLNKEKEVQRKADELNKEAYVNGLNGSELFESLFTDDPEGRKLNLIPNADELLGDFHDKFVMICREMYEFGIKEKETRDKEVNEFWKALNEAKQINTLDATNAINQFIEIKRKVYFFHCLDKSFILYRNSIRPANSLETNRT
jgi:hypothetical protein